MRRLPVVSAVSALAAILLAVPAGARAAGQALANPIQEPVAVGNQLPNMPLFLNNDAHVLVPLEPTYQATWDASPEARRKR